MSNSAATPQDETQKEPKAHSKGDKIIAKVNGDTIADDWQTMKRCAEKILQEAETHKTDLQKAKEMGPGVHIRLSCENCSVIDEVEYARNLINTPEEHVDHPDRDCSLTDVVIEAFCPRHGTIPLNWDECDSCAADRNVMNR